MSNDLRYAVCDVGSNALRLVISRVLGDAPRFLKREARYRVPLRLGEDVFTDGLISEGKVKDVVEACQAFRHLLNLFRPEKFRACATSAMREAQNGQVVADRVWSEAGIRLKIFSGAEEAQTLLYNAAGSWLSPRTNYLFVDVGGGSTELTFLASGKVVSSASFRIGGVRLLANRVESIQWEQLKTWLEGLPKGRGPTCAVGTGGNISAIYELASSNSALKLKNSCIRNVLSALEPLTAEQRIRTFGLKPDRADVIVEAGRVYQRVLEWANIETMVVPKLGLADGLLSEMFHEQYGYWPANNPEEGKVEDT